MAKLGVARFLGVATALALSAAVAAAQPTTSQANAWPAELGWPAKTKSVSAPKAMHIAATAGGKVLVGKLASGAWVGVKRVEPVAGNKCKLWAELGSGGFVCAEALRASEAEPSAPWLPVVAAGELVPGKYFIAAPEGIDIYRTVDDIIAGTPSAELLGNTMVRSLETVQVDYEEFYRTDKGYVPALLVRELHPSQFAGVMLGKDAQLPIHWAVAASEKARAVVDAPRKKAQFVRSLERYQQVTVRGEKDGFLDLSTQRFPNEWVRASAIATAAASTRPSDVAADEYWIDVNRDEQTLVAYHGDTPLFATLVSTGRKAKWTPKGSYKIHAKAAVTAMASEAGESSQYDVSAVPWAMRFAKGLYLHAAYWHDGFGQVRSHGCINLSPRDARFLYELVPPSVPAGWSELEFADRPVLLRIR